MTINVFFLVLMFLCGLCVHLSFRLTRRNPGYILAVIVTAICDLIIFLILGSSDPAFVNRLMPVYYIFHAWLFFGVLLTLDKFYMFTDIYKYAIPSALICIYQTIIMVSVFFGSGVMQISAHETLGSSWWIAHPAGSGFFFSFRMFNDLCIVNTAIIVYVIVHIMIHSARVFRFGFGVMICSQVGIAVLFFLVNVLSLPVWVYCIGANTVCFFGFYMVNFYFDERMKTWALSSFANDMSDGFILYNEHNDLIHMNSVFRNLIPRELAVTFVDRKKLDEWMDNTVKIDKMEVQTCQKVGKDLYFRTRCTELGVKDKKYGVMYIIHDTTESIQEMRVMKRANEELELAAKMKSDFLANMSHEIRTPMNAVIGMAEIALREDLPDNVRDYLSQIQSSGKNLLGIINDILDFSKIESGRMEIIPESYEPLTELNDIAGVLMARIGDKPLELFIITEGYIPRVLEGDAIRIRQIILNLAGNAIKFTKEGTVKIHVKGEKKTSEEAMITFHVTDTGQGIKEEDLGKLFVSFQQVDSKRNRSVEGTGLGLAISQKLCEAMGGKIDVKSEYGKGSDFFFSIPQKVIDPASPLTVENAEGKHAVFLGDDPDLTQMFTYEMKHLGVSSELKVSPDEITHGDKKEYLFFEEKTYDENIKGFLDSNPDMSGIIIVRYDSSFVSSQKNLRVMKKPETTLNLVTLLNDREIAGTRTEERESFTIDFCAPDARFLIVDDNPINITIASGLLAPLGAGIFSADSGKKALEMVKNDTYDIIFMDHMMPEMDGIETTREIRRGTPARKTPIIALTANAMEGARDMFLKEGMNDLVTKPVDVRDLISAVKRWLPEDKITARDESAESGETFEDTERVEYEGLDVNGAIAAIGMTSLYNRIVEEYYRSGRNKHRDISDAYEAEDWIDYTIKVHALKSSSRQIGALALGDLAESLEKAGKAGDLDTIHSDTDRLLSDYSALLDVLSRYFPDEELPSPEDLEEMSPEELHTILEELVTACDNLDMDEMERVRDTLKAHSHPAEVMAHLEGLFEAIDNLDTDACLEAVTAIRSV